MTIFSGDKSNKQGTWDAKSHKAGTALREPTSITGQQLAIPRVYSKICEVWEAAKVIFSCNHP